MWGEPLCRALHQLRGTPLAFSPVLDLGWPKQVSVLGRDRSVGGAPGPSCRAGALSGSLGRAAVRLLDDVSESRFGGEREGYVVRRADRFHYGAFRRSVAKYVRRGHVTTDDHWLHKEMIVNKLRALAGQIS